MDARKIQFLIGIQREIDKLEAKEGNVPKMEKIKSRFYDVAGVEEIVGKSSAVKQDIDNESEFIMPISLEDTDNKEIKLQRRKYTQEQRDENFAELMRLQKDVRLVEHPFHIVRRRSPAGVKKDISSIVVETANQPKKDFPHKPKDVVDFMKLFDDASSLKYLTHDFDEVDQKFSIRSFLNEAKKIFDQYTHTHKFTIPASLWKIINQFAFQKNPQWFAFGKEIAEGWSSEKWIQWSEVNGYPSKNFHFENIIREFKEQVRVRNLSKIINGVIDKKFGDQQRQFNFKFIELEKADFYTHVDSFIAGLEHIFGEICSRPDFSNVTIQLERKVEGEYRSRTIHIYHHESYPSNKTVEEVFEKYQNSGGNLWEARKKLFGYCDWFIETIWDEQPMRIYLLREGMVRNKVDVEIEKLDSIIRPGFTHTLTFYTR